MFSISISILRKSHDFRTVDLVPLRQINADLKSAKEVLARIHEIVLIIIIVIIIIIIIILVIIIIIIIIIVIIIL